MRRKGERRRNQSRLESRSLAAHAPRASHMGPFAGECNRIVVRRSIQDAAATIRASFSTVFQLRAVFGTPMPLSNRSASFERPNPFGVCR